jgi:protease I
LGANNKLLLVCDKEKHMADLAGKKIAIVATDYFEESELTEPMAALKKAGAEVDVIAPKSGEIKGVKHVEPGQSVKVDKTLDNANPDDYDAAVFPGGAINADNLRINQDAKNFITKIMNEHNKPTAVICHAPWLLVSAGLARGKRLTSFHTIQDDLRNAGAEWVDEPVVIDDNLITSRKPDDLSAFNDAIISALS